ncbi:NAD(P)-dependent oxidoreductase [Myxococcus fulvus]|uniref:NAD(P)-dependent oxidoreductase n=1 Tax=Myxococcus fulvus TaxID=33 RepID=UPI003B9A257B
MSNARSDVTVIGLGKMGSALAGAFLRAGHRVTVWNRTMSRAEPLRQAGATLAPSAAAAVEASPLVVVCVSDHPSARAILEVPEVTSALSGRTLVQLSSGTPQEARDLQAWARGRGTDLLCGAVLAWPRQIGTEEAAIVLSGSSQVLRRHEGVLRALGGTLTNMGEAIGAASAMFSAVLTYLATHWIGFAHGAHVCRAEGLDVTDFGETLHALAPGLGQDARHMAKVLETASYAAPESTLETAGNDIARLVQLSQEDGISDAVPRFVAGIFRQAIDAGLGAEEHAAVYKVLQGARQTVR